MFLPWFASNHDPSHPLADYRHEPKYPAANLLLSYFSAVNQDYYHLKT
jgi:hypothetical protein